MPDSEDAFLKKREDLKALKEDEKAKDLELENLQVEETVRLHRLREQHAPIESEIESLRKRRSNIDRRQVEIRGEICSALGIQEGDMPFAGELIQVREEERDWEGAAERLLRGFGLSLLVPEAHYREVSSWVDAHHLNGRFVYFHVRRPRLQDLPALSAHSLARKLSIKPDSVFYEWIEKELAHRFDVACCSSQEAFRREPRAVTLMGQIKDPTGRHEKDDRSRIDDRSRYVLGWSNASKIAALEVRKKGMEEDMAGIAGRLSEILALRRSLGVRMDALLKIEEFQSYREMDLAEPQREIECLEEERERLSRASDVLRALQGQLVEALERAKDSEQTYMLARDQRAAVDERRKNALQMLDEVKKRLLEAEEFEEGIREKMEAMVKEALPGREITLEGAGQREQEVRTFIQQRIDDREKQVRNMADKIVSGMAGFNEEFKLETVEMDPSVASAAEYRGLLSQLEGDDLPRFEQRFKELLNVNTINEIANFNAQLVRERETIRERIERINESLTQIDYSKGRYIRLEAMPTSDADVREFQAELRACTEGALSGTEDAHYSEIRFAQVRRIIDRFRGREGLSDQDRRWTLKVTDVRNWFNFAASERWREDDAEFEHYSDSGGKSGGQKEKLAYTILAASLAYQFGLEWGATRSRSFRFVVIDEAFGRGSDDSTQYGLELFRKLNLQLLIVTPLQKIHIIEPFISGVGFVNNEGGRSSRVLNLSIEEFHEKARDIPGYASAVPASI